MFTHPTAPPPEIESGYGSGGVPSGSSASALYSVSQRQPMQIQQHRQQVSPLPPSFSPLHTRPPVPGETLPAPQTPSSSSTPAIPSSLSSTSASTKPSQLTGFSSSNPSHLEPPSASATSSISSRPQASSVAPILSQPQDRVPSTRKAYHPNPPAHRSEWVMWVGNVPSDATHDELWRFFNQSRSPGAESIGSNTGSVGDSSGSVRVSSIGSSGAPHSVKSNPVYGSAGMTPLGHHGSSLSLSGVSHHSNPLSAAGAASPTSPVSGPSSLKSPIQSSAPQQIDPSSSDGSSAGAAASVSSQEVYGGVSSIFLIVRSNCAFVNFQTDAHLRAAIAHFNGESLRPTDPRVPKLVCRVRGKEDDLKAGVGGQRGSGIHVRYVKDLKERDRTFRGSGRGEDLRRSSISSSERFSSSSSPGEDRPPPSIASVSDEEAANAIMGAAMAQRRVFHTRGSGKLAQRHSSSSGSFASTNSSILMQYFPKRYFILKSLTQVRLLYRFTLTGPLIARHF